MQGLVLGSMDVKTCSQTIAIQRHVHGDETFAGHAVGAQFTKPEWGRDLT